MGYPSDTVDATVNKAMDQAFVGEMQMHKGIIAAAHKSAQQLSNLTDNSFNQQTQLWQANAAQVLLTNRLAENILSQRSARMQPQVQPVSGSETD